MKPLYIGIDDTDSLEGMCTTYLGALLAKDLTPHGQVVGARLIRLNPNNPFKTRGNASVCLEMIGADSDAVKNVVMTAVKEHSRLDGDNTNPGVVFFEGDPPPEFTQFYHRALREMVQIKEAEELIAEMGAEMHKLKNGRGIIGALAAIGADLTGDHTFEHIAYRPPGRWGTSRDVDAASVIHMDRNTSPRTFNNYDYSEERVLITPNTPCPILYGIRGENPGAVEEAAGMISSETAELFLVYTTNQATDAHLTSMESIKDIQPFKSVIATGMVHTQPRNIKGGHVIFSMSDDDGSIDCAAYEPTRAFRETVRLLLPGDRVRVYGGIRNDPLTVNLERVDILDLACISDDMNPLCDSCGKRMESAGVNQGYRCKKCKTKKVEKVKRILKRDLKKGPYQVPPGAMRHLTKPLSRF